MAKKIFPGNWVAQLSSYQGQGVVSEPGRVYYQKTGYAKVDSTGGTSFDVVIPSPDLRGDDKARADITGLTLPAGANVYSVGIRVPDVRKDKGVGTATSGLVGTNTNRLKVADAIGNDATITTTKVASSSADLAVGSTTIAPGTSVTGLVTAATLAGAETLKVYVTDSTGTSAGSTLTSTATGGTYLIVTVSYFVDDAVPNSEDVGTPYVVEQGA
ncbi:MAG: hypothetical protein CMB76_07555 [Euryarchaeota archaeon]|nr:hypothetical protein [Euryarchaeota archaeon]